MVVWSTSNLAIFGVMAIRSRLAFSFFLICSLMDKANVLEASMRSLSSFELDSIEVLSLSSLDLRSFSWVCNSRILDSRSPFCFKRLTKAILDFFYPFELSQHYFIQLWQSHFECCWWHEQWSLLQHVLSALINRPYLANSRIPQSLHWNLHQRLSKSQLLQLPVQCN